MEVRNKNNIRTGIIGTGRIAGRFVAEVSAAAGIEVTAVYNPHPESAKRFGERFGIPAYHNGLTEFLDAVDAVYIASPHETHFEYALEALKHDRHVICEKPMAFSASETQELFLAARDKKLVLMEGIKTVYCPGYRKLIEAAKSGAIGDIRYIESSFTKIEGDDSRELTDKDFGGSFTELGSYGLLPVFDIFGAEPSDIRFDSILNDKGTDIFTGAELSYKDLRLASVKTGLKVKTEGSLVIGGTDGYIKADAPWWKTSSFGIYDKNGSETEHFNIPYEGDGLRYELSEFVDRINGTGKSDDIAAKMEEISTGCAAVFEKFLAGRKK